MSETAQTLIKRSLRLIGAIATGETPTADELAEGLEALRMMLRNWSSRNINIYGITQQSVSLTGATSYTIGSGGTIATTRPVDILSATGANYSIEMIDYSTYQRLNLAGGGGECEKIWYNPLYPLGYLYPWPLSSETITLDCLMPLSDPTAITTSISFPPEYDDAIVYNLALRLAPEYEADPSGVIIGLAADTLKALETRNFANSMKVVRPEILKLATARWNIDYD